MTNIQMINADCIEYMKDMVDKSVLTEILSGWSSIKHISVLHSRDCRPQEQVFQSL